MLRVVTIKLIRMLPSLRMMMMMMMIIMIMQICYAANQGNCAVGMETVLLLGSA